MSACWRLAGRAAPEQTLPNQRPSCSGADGLVPDDPERSQTLGLLLETKDKQSEGAETERKNQVKGGLGKG